MNLTRLFELQKPLDKRIVKEKGLEGQDLLPKKILALQVELGELANEWRGFKFWSKDQEPRTEVGYGLVRPGETRNPLLEEYVDCLHFILSVGLELEPNITEEWEIPKKFERYRYSSDITEYFNLLFGAWNGIENREDIYGYYFWTFAVLAELGEMLGFTWGQIEQAYLAKNQINHERQATGY